jgi:hypothetical protein
LGRQRRIAINCLYAQAHADAFALNRAIEVKKGIGLCCTYAQQCHTQNGVARFHGTKSQSPRNCL